MFLDLGFDFLKNVLFPEKMWIIFFLIITCHIPVRCNPGGPLFPTGHRAAGHKVRIMSPVVRIGAGILSRLFCVCVRWKRAGEKTICFETEEAIKEEN